MKILITGGAGFIGAQLAKEIINRFPEYEITIFDKFNNRERRENRNFKYFGDYKNINELDVKIINGDLSKQYDVQRLLEFDFDVIFHQGAISDTTVLDQEEVLKTNTISFEYFIDYCKINNKRLIYASSAGTYGNSISPNVIGSGEIPENIYGFSKLQMDKITRKNLNQNNNLNIVGLRYFNVYGPGELYKRKTSSMILQLAKQVIEHKKVRLFKYGEQSRDFVYIKDVVNANILAMNAKSGIYNIGSGVSRSFNDIINILEKYFNYNISIEYIDNPFDFYQNNTCADLSLSSKFLNYYPEFDLEKGIYDYLDIIKSYNSFQWNSYHE